MAHLIRCPYSGTNIHIHADDGRTVCLCTKDHALGAIRHGVQLGIISLAESTMLASEINTSFFLAISGKHIPCPGGISHTFVRSSLDALDALFGFGGAVHPDDEN